MQCKNHPGENGVNTCNQCGTCLCESCSFERGGRIFCPECVAQGAIIGGRSSGGGSSGDTTRSYRSTHGHMTKRYVSWGLLFLFSVIIPIPGLNYMYMGLIKRGLVAMSAFFGAIYLLIQFMSSSTWAIGILFVFAIPVLWLATTFDGFRTRMRINSGEVISDNIDDIINFIRRNRSILIGFLLFLLIVNVISSVLPWIFGSLRHIVPIIIAIWAIHALLRKPKS